MLEARAGEEMISRRPRHVQLPLAGGASGAGSSCAADSDDDQGGAQRVVAPF